MSARRSALDRRPAALGRRVGAYVIDGAVATLVLLVAAGILAGISFATGGAFPVMAAAVGAYVVGAGWFFVYTFMQGGAGSIGMRMLGLELAHAADDNPLGFGRALGRNLVWGLGSAIIVGIFSPLFDSSPWRRGWHDRASGAVMTDIAGHGPALPEEVDAHLPQAPVADPSAFVPSASVPSVVPAGLILPTGADGGLDAWPSTDEPAAAPARARTAAAGVIAFVPGVTDPARPEVAAVAPIAVPTVPAAPAAPPGPATPAAALIDPLEHTRVSTGERPAARLRWDDGAQQAVYGRTLFGRNPTPEAGAMVSPVRDETMSLSKTHFELVPDADRTLWVIDRHSTNGVTIVRGIQRQQVTPGERTRVLMGDALEFGDRQVVIEVAS